MQHSDHSFVMAVFLAVGLALALAANIGTDIRRMISGRNVVLLGIAAWYLLEAIKRPVDLDKFDQSQYNMGVLGVALATASFLFAYHRFGNGCGAFARVGAAVQRLDDPSILWKVVLTGAVVGFLPLLYFADFDPIALFDGVLGMRKSWGGVLARGRYGDVRGALLQLEMFITGVAPFAMILLLDRRVPLPMRVLAVGIVIWPILRAYGIGTRSAIITGVVPTLAVVWLRLTPKWQKLTLAGAILSAPLIYQFMAAMVVSRGQGEFTWESGDDAKYVGNEMFRELLFIQSKVPELAPYQRGYVYFVQIVNPIPRFIWEGKPTLDSGLLMAEWQDMMSSSGEAILTVSPGLIGEMYMNFGWLGIAGLSAFGGWLVRGWDRMAAQYAGSVVTMVYYFGGLGVLFIMGRSFTMNMFYALLSFALLAWVYGILFGGRPSQR